MLTLPLPRSSVEEGVSLTAFPASDGEERAIVEAAIVTKKKRKWLELKLLMLL